MFRSFISAGAIALFATLGFSTAAWADGPKVLKKVPPDSEVGKAITERINEAKTLSTSK